MLLPSNLSFMSNHESVQKIAYTLNNPGSNYFQQATELHCLRSFIKPHVTHLVLSNPCQPPQSCLAFFSFFKANYSLGTCKSDIQDYACLISTLYHAQKFAEMKNILNYIVTAENHGVPEERSCFVILLALKKCGEVDLLTRFFRKMVDSGRVVIKVQSLTLVIDVLCQKRELERAKALMDEMEGKGIVEPNVVTYNTLLKAYIARKDQNGINVVLS
ncbi:hypothetical protein K1719_026548 [Acacia pycnantha]|nr:hypothetical protein K1719_026548 [Acacia pycnantha]